MRFNIADDFERTVGLELERIRVEKAKKFVDYWEKGIITCEELRDKLTEIVEEF